MSSINMVTVTSTNVQEIGYDDTYSVLYVRFLNNTLYIYKGVPPYEFDGLLNAPSVGTYLNKNIKNSYPYERIA